MSFFNKYIPRRQLTPDSTKELHGVHERVLSEILKQSCPCRYPRFRFLVGFNHEHYKAGPVLCADTNYLVSIACYTELNYLTLIR